MTKIATILLALLTMAGFVPAGFGADDPANFDAFKIILERNIFNASRQAQPPPAQRPRAEIRPERITLLGVLVDGNNSAAFFDGSRSEYTRAVRTGEEIAGYKVVDIGTDKVRLANGDKKIEIRVASRMEKLGDNPWTLAEGGSGSSEFFREDGTSSRSMSDKSQSDSAISSGDGQSGSAEPSSDLVKRLMERRRREMGE